MGGVAKPLLPVGGVPMLRRVLSAIADARLLVVVGPPELVAELPAEALLTREDPPGGGPVAAIAAGAKILAAGNADRSTPVARDRSTLAAGDRDGSTLAAGDRDRSTPMAGDADRVVVVAADLPFLTRDAVAALLAVDADVVMFTDADGRRQHLCAAWRLGALRAALPAQPHGAPMRVLLAGADVVELPWAGGGPAPWYDCDTPDELQAAQAADLDARS